MAIGQRTISVDKGGFSGDESTIVLQSGQVANVEFELSEAAMADSFETDSGWTRDPGDTANTGFWSRSDPVGSGGGTIQPEDDHTPAPGTHCYFTGQGLSGGNPELGDVDGGTATLLSPLIDLSVLPSPTFRYHRWFSTSGGVMTGGTMRIEVSDDGGSNWTTVELLSSEASSWVSVAVPLDSYVTLNDQFRARFACEAITAFDQQRILECALDDIEIVQECRARTVAGGIDNDSDGVLDACDACPFDPVDDLDGDGLCGDVDNAPFDANPGQADSDADGVGDIADNCLSTVNPNQVDLDGDGAGDLCDSDIDGDGLDDTADVDDDNDGVLDASDICGTVPDRTQSDRDGNGAGDACDAGDGVVHGVRMDGDRIAWAIENSATEYSLYRAELGDPVLIRFGTCRASGLSAASYMDTDLPEPGSGWAYLVAARIASVEQGLGEETDGTPRVVNSPCP